jgi:hypothetical protein
MIQETGTLCSVPMASSVSQGESAERVRIMLEFRVLYIPTKNSHGIGITGHTRSCVAQPQRMTPIPAITQQNQTPASDPGHLVHDRSDTAIRSSTRHLASKQLFMSP